MRNKADLVFSCSHKMCRKCCLCDAIKDILINLARNVARPELVFDPAIQLENVLMRVPHLLRHRANGIGARAIRDVARITATDIDHDRLVAFQNTAAAHHRHGGVKATHADWTIEGMRICGSLGE